MNTKTHRLFPSPKYKEWHDVAMAEILHQKTMEKLMFPIAEPVRIELEFHHADNRRRDSDNGTTSILDLLCDSDVLTDDCWQIVQELNVKNVKDYVSFCLVSVDKLN